MTELYTCDYDLSLSLKKLGYHWGAFAFYYPNYPDAVVLNEYSMRGGTVRDLIRCHNNLLENVSGHLLIDAPSIYDAQSWLRAKKNISVEVMACAGGYVWELVKAYNPANALGWVGGTTIYLDDSDDPLLNDCGRYETFELALSQGMKAAVKYLEMLNEKTN
jgi:hypothetical protein